MAMASLAIGMFSAQDAFAEYSFAEAHVVRVEPPQVLEVFARDDAVGAEPEAAVLARPALVALAVHADQQSQRRCAAMNPRRPRDPRLRIVAKVRRDHRAAVRVELGVPLHEEQQVAGRPRVAGHEERDFLVRHARDRRRHGRPRRIAAAAPRRARRSPTRRHWGARRRRRSRTGPAAASEPARTRAAPSGGAPVEQRKDQGDFQRGHVPSAAKRAS